MKQWTPHSTRRTDMKKRNKSYRPKAARIPLFLLTAGVLNARPHLATSLYGQIIAFCVSPSYETSNNLTKQLAIIAGGMSHMDKGRPILGKRDAASIAICSAINCLESVAGRYDRTGKVAINEAEKQTLHAAAGRLDETLQVMPLSCYALAEREVSKALTA